MGSRKWPEDHPRFGSMAISTPDRSITSTPYWAREAGFAPMHRFWDHFSQTGEFVNRELDPTPEGQSDACGLGVKMRLKPGESRTATFYFTWYFPNFEMYWHSGEACCHPQDAACDQGNRGGKPVWRNYYAGQFSDAFDVARQLHADRKRLYGETDTFRKALLGSTLPPAMLYGASSTLAILRSTTVLRLPDGTFYGFEGGAPIAGCCEGSCTHVWNYQQALAYLFPGLERSMRTADYTYNLRDDGHMGFRMQLPPGSGISAFHACADGQMGGIVKAWRDWKLSGDDDWLRGIWPAMKKALAFAWKDWDPDRDGVMTGIQHNTYDIEFQGPNPLMAGFYLAALKAAADIARHFGEDEQAEEYAGIYRRGRAWTEEHLFNGDYYEQHHDPEQAPINQFGAGCLSDQLLGQQLAALAGLGDVLDPRRVRKTLRSIYRHNFLRDLSEHANAQRVYALNDEAGLTLCSWPRGSRLEVPFIYSDEVWTGIEYQVAAHCLHEGLASEALAICQAVMDRHNGANRNPFDQFECGHHYARAMAAWGLIVAAAGFTCDLGAGRLRFAPRLNEDHFSCFWSVDGAWGAFKQVLRVGKLRAELHVLRGAVTLSALELAALADRQQAAVKLGGRDRKAALDGDTLRFPAPVKLTPKAPLVVTA
jgi:hypothetical protein